MKTMQYARVGPWARSAAAARSAARLGSRAAVVALAAVAAGWVDRGHTTDMGDDDPRRVPVTVSPRVHAHPGVDAPVVIVALDGVRWQEIFEGTEPARSPANLVPASEIVPNLYRLGVERGAFIGAPGRGVIAASGPNYVSLPGYTEILSGRPSRCHENDCPRTSTPTLLDEARAAGAKVAVFSSWERIELAATAKADGIYVSCGRRGDPAVDPFPGFGDYRPDRFTAAAALAYYEAEQPDVFFLGLGDSDEYAHRGDYPRYVEALRRADEVIGRLVAALDRSGERGRRTHVVVTADHGRARSFADHGRVPEAARVWMVAAGPAFSARGPVATFRQHYLADIAPTLRVVLGLRADTSERAGLPIGELFEETPIGLR